MEKQIRLRNQIKRHRRSRTSVLQLRSFKKLSLGKESCSDESCASYEDRPAGLGHTQLSSSVAFKSPALPTPCKLSSPLMTSSERKLHYRETTRKVTTPGHTTRGHCRPPRDGQVRSGQVSTAGTCFPAPGLLRRFSTWHALKPRCQVWYQCEK